jgi:hypothetical protein
VRIPIRALHRQRMPDRETFPKRAGPGSRARTTGGPFGNFESSSKALGPRDANALARSVRGRGQSHGRVVLARRNLPPNRSGRHVKLFPRVDERGSSAPGAALRQPGVWRGVKAPGVTADEETDGNVSRNIAPPRRALTGPHTPGARGPRERRPPLRPVAQRRPATRQGLSVRGRGSVEVVGGGSRTRSLVGRCAANVVPMPKRLRRGAPVHHSQGFCRYCGQAAPRENLPTAIRGKLPSRSSAATHVTLHRQHQSAPATA